MNPYYQDSMVTIYHGNCLEIIPMLCRADLILTDPPYGETSLSWDEWPINWPNIFSGFSDQLWCFGSMRMFLDHVEDFTLWKFAQDIVWEKHNGSGMMNDRFRRVHEHMLHFYRGKWGDLIRNPPIISIVEPEKKRHIKKGRKPQHWGGLTQKNGYKYEGKRLCRSVIHCRSMHRQAVHPTQKPAELIARLITYSTNPGDLILDPFAGSFSTARVAKDLGRKCIAIEVEEKYCEIGARLMQQEVLNLVT